MITILCIACFLFQGCKFSKLAYGNGNKWIPTDFDPASTILLVQEYTLPGKDKQRIEEFMHEKYPYRYEFVPMKTIKSREGKYADTKSYRYALVFTSNLYGAFPVDGMNHSFGQIAFDFHFYDRESDRDFPPTYKPSSYASWTFKPVINTIRQKYK
jgi:hypothetical protein